MADDESALWLDGCAVGFGHRENRSRRLFHVDHLLVGNGSRIDGGGDEAMGEMAAVSFEKDIRPLFTDEDADHMKKKGVSLRDYAYMKQPENASNVYKRLVAKDMPPDGWLDEQIARFKEWVDGGYQP